ITHVPGGAQAATTRGIAKKLKISLGYHGSCTGGVARKGENDQQISRQRLRSAGLLWPCARPARQKRFGRSRCRFPHALGSRSQGAEAAERYRPRSEGRR